MKKRTKLLITFAGLALFVLLIAIAFAIQSAYMLYAASLLPVFIIPFMPDLRSNQWLKAGHGNAVSLYLLRPQGAPSAEFLVLEFQQGKVNWHKQTLYFPVFEEKLPVFAELKESGVSLSVLPFDLVAARKPGWFGIRLQHLLERSSSFSFTYKEVGQLVIRLDDLRATARGTSSNAPAAASGTGLQA